MGKRPKGIDAMAAPAVYSRGELAKVRAHLETRRNEFGSLAPGEKYLLLERIMKDNPRLIPFAGFAATDAGLFEKLRGDPDVARLSFARFMPELAREIKSGKGNEMRLEFFRDEGLAWSQADFLSRVYLAAKIVLPERTIVVKPTDLMHSDEGYVSRYASQHGIGTFQYRSISNWIVESAFPESQLFHNVLPQMANGDAEALGSRLGHILAVLHRHRILYNNKSIRPEKGSNLFFQNGEARLFDFSWSIHAKNYPCLNKMQIVRFTQGMCELQKEKNFRSGHGDPDAWANCNKDHAGIRKFLRERIPLEKFLENDILLVETGISRLGEAYREIGRIIMERLRQAYKKEI